MPKQNEIDTKLAEQAAKIILNGRHPVKDFAQVQITLDHVIATVLLATSDLDPVRAAHVLNEGTLPHVEERFMLYAKNGGAG